MKVKKITALLLAGAIMASTVTGCGINKNATLATIGDTKISLGLVNFMCRYQQAVYDDMYTMYGMDDPWNQDLSGSGSTTAESTKDSVVESVHELYTLKLHMDDYDVEITDDEKKEIQDTAKEFMDSNSKDALNEMGATEDIVEEMLTLYKIKAKMTVAIEADADTNVSDDEANMRSYTLLTINTDSYQDDDGNTVEYTDEEVDNLKDEAAAIDKQLESGKSDITKVGESYGLTAESDQTYDADDDSLDEDLKKALDELKEGETSSEIDTDTAIYFARIDSDHDEEATEQNRQSIIDERKDTLYSDTLEGWQEDDGWKIKEKLLKKISFFNRFTQETETEEATESTESVVDTENSTENLEATEATTEATEVENTTESAE